jgi:glycerol kinase
MAIVKPRYILALDQGTTGTRAVIYNENARRVTATSVPLTTVTPEPGWQEQRPLDIWRSAQTAIADALIDAGVRGGDIQGIGIANQRETAIVWDRQTGQPIYNAIVWSSTQSQQIADQLAADGFAEMIHEKTGLPLSAYFSATKIRWILDHVPGAQQRAEAGELAFGTVDSWLIWNLTDGQTHVTDVSNAARTMLFNIESMNWDADLMAIFNIPDSMMPEVHPSSGVVATTNALQFFGGNVPIAGVIGDQNSALVGQLALDPGEVKNTYGAGAFMILNTGDKLVTSKTGLVSTIAYQVGDRPTYALEGSIFTAGTGIQWLADRLGMIDNQLGAWEAAERSGNADEVYVVPAFTGLGAPYWDPHARGAAFGMTRGTTDDDFVKATLQSIAYQTAAILKVMAAESTYQPASLHADGTVSRNPYLMQFQADIGDVVVERSVDEDTTPLGAAFLAGIAVGYWSDLETLRRLIGGGREFVPKMASDKRLILQTGWQHAVAATRYFAGG